MDDLNHPNAKAFEFRGDAKEWFGIWIVNLLLSIVTIGIYSAWAKVRRKKYFYNNTFVDGRNFDYHATGKQILFGRLIVIAGMIMITLSFLLYAPIGVVLVMALFIFFPWLLVRSIKFNARMSSFSNVRFDFHGRPGKAFLIYVVMPLVVYVLIAALILGAASSMMQGASPATFLTAGILAVAVAFFAVPFIDRTIKRYTVSNHALGVSGLEMNAPLRPFLVAAAAASIWLIGMSLIVAIVSGFSFDYLGSIFNVDGQEDGGVQVGFQSNYVFFFLAYLPAAAIYQAFTRNAIFNNTELAEGHKFVSNVTAPKLVWIILSNTVVTLLTLGLMLPWAQVRMAKYLAYHTTAIPNGSMDDFVGEILPEGSAIGDAYTDLEAIDIGLPL